MCFGLNRRNSNDYNESVNGPKTQKNIILWALKQGRKSAYALTATIGIITGRAYPAEASVRRAIQDLRRDGYNVILTASGQYAIA